MGIDKKRREVFWTEYYIDEARGLYEKYNKIISSDRFWDFIDAIDVHLKHNAHQSEELCREAGKILYRNIPPRVPKNFPEIRVTFTIDKYLGRERVILIEIYKWPKR